MLIVPTEKHFEWQRAPFVLIAIVLLNIFVFVTYQSKDAEKAYAAIEPFVEQGWVEQEWPLYQQFLESERRKDELVTAKEYVASEDYYSLAQIMLLDTRYYPYVLRAAKTEFDYELYLQWKGERTVIQDSFNSMSSLALGLRASDVQLKTLFTHQFLHGGFGHIFGNMLFLVAFGFAVEAAIGHIRFLLFYLIGGVCAGLAQVVTTLGSDIPLVGASGAISAVMAMYLAVFRLRKIEFFYWVLFFVGYFRAPALMILPFYIGKEFYAYFTAVDSNVAYMAHAGGIAAGAVLIGISLLFSRDILDHEYIEQDQKINTRSKRLADIYKAIESMRFDFALKQMALLMKQEGADFELVLIRFNLEKIKRGKNFIPCFRLLMTLPNLSDDELKILHKLWLETNGATKLLPSDAQLTLAFQFTRLTDLTGAEQIIDNLHAQKFKPSDLILLSSRLANRFSEKHDHGKNMKYQELAQSLTQEGHHGLV